MKKISWVLLLLSFCVNLSAQTLTVGEKASFQKGSINVDRLTDKINKMQDEVKKRVLHDLVIKAFNDTKTQEKSFATYQYLYDLIEVVLNAKNPEQATKAIISDMIRFAVLNELRKAYRANITTTLTSKAPLAATIKSFYDKADEQAKKLEDGKTEDGKSLLGGEKEFQMIHLQFDIIYALLRETGGGSINAKIKAISPTLEDNINLLFIEPLKDKAIDSWFKNDNILSLLENKEISEFAGYNLIDVTQLKDDIRKYITTNIATIIGNNTLSKLLSKALSSGIRFDQIDKEQIEKLIETMESIASEFQYGSRNLALLSSFTRFALEHVQFNQVTLADGSNKLKDISINFETLIQALNAKYNNPDRKPHSVPTWTGLNFLKPRIILKMGLNTGFFIGDNVLAKNDAGQPVKLDKVYFASEKLGLQFNFMDRGYTHSFKVGEPFLYHGSYRTWKRPQPDPLIYRIHLEVYGSGLLYNLANLKTTKDFNYMIGGINLGVTFFNRLSVSAGIARPFNVQGSNNNEFFTFSVDIPIIEYLSGK